jgi:hypothetical protein
MIARSGIGKLWCVSLEAILLLNDIDAGALSRNTLLNLSAWPAFSTVFSDAATSSQSQTPRQ